MDSELIDEHAERRRERAPVHTNNLGFRSNRVAPPRGSSLTGRSIHIRRIESGSVLRRVNEAETESTVVLLQPSRFSSSSQDPLLSVYAEADWGVLASAHLVFITATELEQDGLPINHDTLEDTYVGVISRLSVHPHAEPGSPLVFRLVERIAVEARLRGVRRLHTNCHDTDVRLMERLGFRRCGRLRVEEGWLNPVEAPLDSQALRARGGALEPALSRVAKIESESGGSTSKRSFQ